MSNIARELKLLRGSWFIKNDDNWQEVDLEDAYSSGFVEKINSHAYSKPSSDYVNELFLYYFIKCSELKQTIGEVCQSSYSWNSKLTDKGILFRLKKELGFDVRIFKTILFYLQSLATFCLSVLMSIFVAAVLPFIFFIKMSGKCHVSKSSLRLRKKIFLVRSKSGYFRAKGFIAEDADCFVLVDNFSGLKVPGESIYSVLRSASFPRIYIKTLQYTFRDLFLFYKDAKMLLGTWFAMSVSWEYWKRIPQKALYEACLMKVLELAPANAEVFSGEKEDRFALLQTRCCARKDIRLTCLPHGLEYGFRFPGGLCGDSFYCFSENAKEILGLMYSSGKFLFSNDVLNKMLGINTDSGEGAIERVCFFTEPRDQHVNFEIIDNLVEMNIRLSIKLHPLESQKIYHDRYPGIEIVSDLQNALSSSTCLSRKSTVLVEASQRGKRTLAILINKKDKFYVENLFPSLSSERIVKISNFEDLRQALVTNNDG